MSLRKEINKITGSVSGCVLGLTPEEATGKILRLVEKRIDDLWAEMGDDGNIGLVTFYRELKKKCLG